jgi:dTDP-4-amino-4,6-dideoxygalactose transaminase
MKVPFVDLPAQHRQLRPELETAIGGVLDRCDFILGEEVELLEQEFAAFCGVAHAVGVDSGLSALELALRAHGIGPGDEVIVPANTFVATAAAVTFAGATPVLVDVDPVSYNLDPQKAEEAITPRTRAILPVHLYGLPAPMPDLVDLAQRHGLVLVEDACQAHGARCHGRPVGSWGQAAAFSFYPAKNLGACGDAGMLVTNDPEVAAQARAMRNCGQRAKYHHDLAPFNHRLDTLQAAVLRVKLPHLERWSAERRRRAEEYGELLAGSEVVTPVTPPELDHVFHLYVVRAPDRDRLRQYLEQQGISTGIHYPVPIHRQPFYADHPLKWDELPVTERLADEIVSLPMFPELTSEQVSYVAEAIRAYYRDASGSTTS